MNWENMKKDALVTACKSLTDDKVKLIAEMKKLEDETLKLVETNHRLAQRKEERIKTVMAETADSEKVQRLQKTIDRVEKESRELYRDRDQCEDAIAYLSRRLENMRLDQ